jgi:hypothetical protein
MSSVRKSFSKDGCKDQAEGDKILTVNAKSLSTRIIVNTSNDRSLNSAEKSPISKIPTISANEEKESENSDI